MRNPVSGEIEVRSLFHMHGRGAIAIGYPRSGSARVGQQTQPLALVGAPPLVLTLEAIQPVRSPDGGADAVGLLFRERPSLDALRAVLTPGMLLRFEDGPGEGDRPE